MLVSALLSLIILTFSFSFFDKNEISEEEEMLGFCGTVNDVFYLDENDKEHYLSGKKLFKTECAMCHNKNMKDDMTGPGLGGSISRWENDTAKLANYLNNPGEYLLESKDTRIHALHVKFGQVKKPTHRAYTTAEINAILAYIELIQ